MTTDAGRETLRERVGSKLSEAQAATEDATAAEMRLGVSDADRLAKACAADEAYEDGIDAIMEAVDEYVREQGRTAWGRGYQSAAKHWPTDEEWKQR